MASWNKPEVLAPAGDFERLVAAVRYGADAVQTIICMNLRMKSLLRMVLERN